MDNTKNLYQKIFNEDKKMFDVLFKTFLVLQYFEETKIDKEKMYSDPAYVANKVNNTLGLVIPYTKEGEYNYSKVEILNLTIFLIVIAHLYMDDNKSFENINSELIDNQINVILTLLNSHQTKLISEINVLNMWYKKINFKIVFPLLGVSAIMIMLDIPLGIITLITAVVMVKSSEYILGKEHKKIQEQTIYNIRYLEE